MARVLPGVPRLAATLFFAGSGLEAMALGVSWMGWRHLAARHGQQRRGYSGRSSERSHHVCGSWSCNFRGAGRRKTGFAAV